MTPEPTEKTPQQRIDELTQANAALTGERDALNQTVTTLKAKVGAASKEFQSVSTAATAAKDALGDVDQDNSPKHRKLIAVAICATQVILGWIVSIPVASRLPADLPFKDYGGQAALLGYCVSLSAYLASVRREAVKSLESKTGDQRRQRKWETILVTGGEQALVVLGLFAAARIATWLSITPANDAFLIALALVNVIYLAAVHAVEWFGPIKIK